MWMGQGIPPGARRSLCTPPHDVSLMNLKRAIEIENSALDRYNAR